jgi:hypothetical protein
MDIYVLVMLCFAATRSIMPMIQENGGVAFGNGCALVTFIVGIVFQSMAL